MKTETTVLRMEYQLEGRPGTTYATFNSKKMRRQLHALLKAKEISQSTFEDMLNASIMQTKLIDEWFKIAEEIEDKYELVKGNN